MIHLCRTDKVDAILKDGLRTGMPPDLTLDAEWALAWYETNPVFLADEDSDFVLAMTTYGAFRDAETIDVDTAGLALVADLASLVDKGGRYSSADGTMSWRKGRAPEGIADVLDRRGAVRIRRLLNPSSEACKAAITLTRTAACVADIGPERLCARTASPAPKGP
jgi:hypothetical protein